MAQSIKKGLAWTAIEKFSVQGVQFILGIIIARFITPSEYGVLGVIMVFINISQVFIESGLGSALIYRNNLEEKDLQTTFTFNIAFSLLIFIILFCTAGLIESFFSLENLASYLRVSIIVLILNSFLVVPTAILQVKMNFKSIAITNFSATLVSGGLGCVAAIYGFGVWALILQLLSKGVVQAFLLNILCKWKPRLKFFKDSFLSMYRYSLAIFGTSCITKLTGEGISFFIAKILTPYSLGIFTRANQFASLTGTSLGSIFSTVLFPVFSSRRDGEGNFNDIYNKTVVYQGLVIIPIFALLAVLSKPIIILLLTEKWIDVVPVLQILAVGRILSTISTVTEQAICASGRSDLEFKQQFYKIVLKVICFIIGFKWGLNGIAIADAVSTFLSFYITNFFARRCEGFSVKGQTIQLLPFIVAAAISSVVSLFVISCIDSIVLSLVAGFSTFVLIYFILMFFFERNLMRDINNIIKGFMKQ